MARRAAARFHALAETAAQALEEGNREAYRRAVEALEVAKAGFVVRVFSPRVTARVLHHAIDRIHRLQARLAAAAGTDQDLSHIRRRVEAAIRLVRQGNQAVTSGDPVTGLRFGARALDVLGGID